MASGFEDLWGSCDAFDALLLSSNEHTDKTNSTSSTADNDDGICLTQGSTFSLDVDTIETVLLDGSLTHEERRKRCLEREKRAEEHFSLRSLFTTEALDSVVKLLAQIHAFPMGGNTTYKGNGLAHLACATGFKAVSLVALVSKRVPLNPEAVTSRILTSHNPYMEACIKLVEGIEAARRGNELPGTTAKDIQHVAIQILRVPDDEVVPQAVGLGADATYLIVYMPNADDTLRVTRVYSDRPFRGFGPLNLETECKERCCLDEDTNHWMGINVFKHGMLFAVSNAHLISKALFVHKDGYRYGAASVAQEIYRNALFADKCMATFRSCPQQQP